MSATVIALDKLAKFKYPQPPYYTVREMFIDYSKEKLIAKGKDPRHAWTAFNHFMNLKDRDSPRAPHADASKLAAADFDDFIDERESSGIMLTTVRRELTPVKAAIRHAARRKGRLPKIIEFEMPSGEGRFRRPLSETEFELVRSKVMSERLMRFYWAAYHTGHRSRAIEELTWDRVDFDKRMIDFNVPGRRRHNKRRADDFPITDDFLPLLLEWKASAKDSFVIGLSVQGKCSSTFNEASYVVRVLCGLTDPLLAPRHCMRGMYATEMFDKGADPEVVGHLMRDDPKTLRKHYVKFKQSKLMSVANLRSKAML